MKSDRNQFVLPKVCATSSNRLLAERVFRKPQKSCMQKSTFIWLRMLMASLGTSKCSVWSESHRVERKRMQLGRRFAQYFCTGIKILVLLKGQSLCNQLRIDNLYEP